MADLTTDQEWAAEEARQAKIAAGEDPEAKPAEPSKAPVVAGESAPAADAASAPADDEPVEVVLAADATAPYVNEDGSVSEEPVNEVAIAGAVLKPGEPTEVAPDVARLLVNSEDNVEVVA